MEDYERRKQQFIDAASKGDRELRKVLDVGYSDEGEK